MTIDWQGEWDPDSGESLEAWRERQTRYYAPLAERQRREARARASYERLSSRLHRMADRMARAYYRIRLEIAR